MRFDRDNLPLGNFEEYRRSNLTRAVQMDQPFECLTIDGNVADGKPGDYLCLDSEGYPYPCAESVFDASYEPA